MNSHSQLRTGTALRLFSELADAKLLSLNLTIESLVCEYIDDKWPAKKLHADISKVYGDDWQKKMGRARVKGRAKGKKMYWDIEDEIFDEPYQGKAGYIMDRLSPRSPKLPQHPTHEDSLVLHDTDIDYLNRLSDEHMKRKR